MMPDREKVLKGLACVAQKEAPTANPCAGCGYADRANFAFCVRDIAADALALLKEQDAVEPYSMNAERTYGICPKCGKIVFRYGNVEENHYCGICGQAVKWE